MPVDDKAGLILDETGRAILAEILTVLTEANDWTAAGLDAAVRVYAEGKGLKLGKVAQPIRVALTGRSTSPGVFDVLEVLGRNESLARISDQLVT